MQFNITVMSTPPPSGSSRQTSVTRGGEGVTLPSQANASSSTAVASGQGTAAPEAVASTSNPFGIPSTADGVPLFTVEQLQILQRQTLSQLSQQRQQQQQSASSLGPSQPFMVLTQVPVQTGSSLLHSPPNSTATAPPQQQQQTPSATSGPAAQAGGPYSQFGPLADFLQPTPLSLECERQNRLVVPPKPEASPSSRDAADSASASKLAAQLLQTHFQQLAELPKCPETEQLLQSLLQAAQSPVAPLPTQPQQQPQTQPQLNMLGSGLIEPLHSSSSSTGNHDPIMDSALWKAFFEDEDDNQGILNRKPSATAAGGATASDRQLDRGDILSPPSTAQATASSIQKPPPTTIRTHASMPFSATSGAPEASPQTATVTSAEEDFLMDFDPTPLSEMISSMRPDTPDESFSLSDQLRQFQLHQSRYSPQSSQAQPSAPPFAHGSASLANQALPSVPPSAALLNPSQQQFHQPPQHGQEQQQKKRQQRGSRSTKRKAVAAPAPAASLPELAQAPFTAQSFSLPSVYVPPSVLASVLTPALAPISVSGTAPTGSTSSGSFPAVGGISDTSESDDARVRQRAKSKRLESPQHVLERILSARGVRWSRIKSEDAGYDATPSPLQLASFGTELVKAFHSSDVERMGKLLSCGLSPNPCNQFRDSIVDLVCKRGNAAIFQCLVEHGCDLRVCDGFGRTPLHHSAWSGSLCKPIVRLVLQIDWIQLLIEDKRGQTPLEYVRPEVADEWVEFLEGECVNYLPSNVEVERPDVRLFRGDGHLANPPDALPVQLASAVSSGKLSIEEVQNLSPDMRARFH